MNVTTTNLDARIETRSVKADESVFHAQTSGTKDSVKTGAAAFASSIGERDGAEEAYGRRVRPEDNTLLAKDRTASKNLDVVLSHTLSDEDYRRAKEEGFDPRALDPAESDTIVDHIKAALLTSGTEVAGFTDDLSREQLTKITGSEAYAAALADAFHRNDIPLTEENVTQTMEAVSRAETLTPLSDGAVRYLLENELAPTLDHLYLASHAAKGQAGAGGKFYAQEGGYIARRAEDTDLSALRPQIEEVAKQALLSPDDETVRREAEQLIRDGVPLTASHLGRAHTLHALQLPPERTAVLDAAAQAIASGKRAQDAALLPDASALNEAVRLYEETKAITDEAVAQVADSGEPVTLRHLIDATQAAGDASSIAPQETTPAIVTDPYTAALTPVQTSPLPAETIPMSTEALAARKQLEEVRLMMSVQTNFTLIRQGITIDTAPMEELIASLRQAIRDSADALFSAMPSEGGAAYDASLSGGMEITDAAGSYRLYYEANVKVAYLKNTMPVGVIGAVQDEFATDTLDDIFSKATTWKPSYAQAEAAYDLMGTQVRADLGDSLKKAFRNVDEMLQQAGRELTEDHRRAVRILAYNRMEITAEAIDSVSAWDARLQNVLDELKPAAVLSLIREGKNPLQMTLDELAASLSDASLATGASDEKYARFLYKLEQSASISESEREAYIGIYRMFETLKRTDHAAIGTLLHTGADMTIKNLLGATRTQRAAAKGIDVTADDAFRGLQASGTTGSITAQIEQAFRYYSDCADSAFARMSPEKMHAMSETTDPAEATLPAFCEAMETLPDDDALDASYDRETLRQMRDTLAQAAAEPDAEELLQTLSMPVTAHHLEAAKTLMQGRTGGKGETFFESAKRLLEKNGAAKPDFLDDLLGGMDADEDFATHYTDAMEEASSALSTQELTPRIDRADMQAVSLLHRQVSVIRQAARQGSFEIPVTIEDRTLSMHVTLAQAEDDGAGVTVSLETEAYGLLKAGLSVRAGQVSGMISASYGETAQVRAGLTKIREAFARALQTQESTGELTVEETEISLVFGAPYAQIPVTNGEKTGTRQLFGLAKAFAMAVAE